MTPLLTVKVHETYYVLSPILSINANHMPMKKRSLIKQIVEAKVRSQFTIQPIITSKLDPSYRYSLN